MRLRDLESPVTADEFAGLMAAFAPFERAPVLAVATSGGGDSLALAVLAAEWAVARSGAAVALVVDHGLRAESGPEAAGVACRLGAAGIGAEVLRWAGDKPRTGVQAAARSARRGLLGDWCRRQGVLHLLLAHQAEDQVETFVMRRRRRSGPVGLAAMSAVVEDAHHRLLRPLLAVPRARLRATLRARGWTWIDDPSNLDPRFERVRVRQQLARHPGYGLRAVAVAGAERIRLDRAVAALLAASVRFAPAGFARIDPETWARAEPMVRQVALRRILLAIGGRDVPPAPAALARLEPGLIGTLAGCRIVRHGGLALVCQELRGVMAPRSLDDGSVRWDGRFRVTTPRPRPDLSVGALGHGDASLAGGLPRAIRATLPCVRNLAGGVAVPYVRLQRGGTDMAAVLQARFDRSRGFARPFAVPAAYGAGDEGGRRPCPGDPGVLRCWRPVRRRVP